MKKLFALILALVMMTALSVTAFAAPTTNTLGGGTTIPDPQEITVTGVYTIGAAGNIYSIDITWDGMVFTYIAKAEWDAENHKPVDTEQNGGTWRDTTGTINVKNNSNNLAVKVTMAFEATPANAQIHSAIQGSLTGDTNVDALAMRETASANFKVTDGELKVGLTPDTEVDIGIITVTIAAVDQQS